MILIKIQTEEILKEKSLWSSDYNDFDFLDQCKNVFKVDDNKTLNLSCFVLEDKIKEYIVSTMKGNKVEKKIFIMNNLLNFKHNPPIVSCCLMNLYHNVPSRALI